MRLRHGWRVGGKKVLHRMLAERGLDWVTAKAAGDIAKGSLVVSDGFGSHIVRAAAVAHKLKEFSKTDHTSLLALGGF